jgi:hypothetical protein
VILSWPAPALGRSESSTSYIARVDVYRLSEPRDEEPVIEGEDFESLAQIVGYLDRAAIEAQAREGRLQFTDTIDLARAEDISNVRLRYAVRYINGRGQMAAFSATVAVEPAPVVAMPPAEVKVEGESQDRVEVTWRAPEGNVDGSRPAVVLGYNVYRRQARRDTFSNPLNADPVDETRFVDTRFRYDTEYVYVVRSLSQGPTGLIESADSEEVSFKPVDRFAPAAPDPVSIASANLTISLFWPRNAERDTVGYNVYRAESADAKDWIRLNEQPLTAVTFHDDRVTVGRRYFYRVTALDTFDNESPPSRTVSEMANP